jgi:hypothetical protein
MPRDEAAGAGLLTRDLCRARDVARVKDQTIPSSGASSWECEAVQFDAIVLAELRRESLLSVPASAHFHVLLDQLPTFQPGILGGHPPAMRFNSHSRSPSAPPCLRRNDRPQRRPPPPFLGCIEKQFGKFSHEPKSGR